MAKRVKWERDDGMGVQGYRAKLAAGHSLWIGMRADGMFAAEICVPFPEEEAETFRKEFKKLESAKRYCIREALKLHKLVGTQLTQLEEK